MHLFYRRSKTAKERGENMEFVLNFIVSIVASMIAN